VARRTDRMIFPDAAVFGFRLSAMFRTPDDATILLMAI